MALINSSAVFSTPEEILPRELLDPSITIRKIQKVSVVFTDGEENNHGNKV